MPYFSEVSYLYEVDWKCGTLRTALSPVSFRPELESNQTTYTDTLGLVFSILALWVLEDTDELEYSTSILVEQHNEVKENWK